MVCIYRGRKADVVHFCTFALLETEKSEVDTIVFLPASTHTDEGRKALKGG